MSLWKIAWRSIQQRALASSLTGLSMALGVALVVAVLVGKGVISDSFTPAGGYHLVVGKKGSQLQLVLNTVYHLQDPIENLPYSFYKEFITTADHKGNSPPTCRPRSRIAWATTTKAFASSARCRICSRSWNTPAARNMSFSPAAAISSKSISSKP